MCVARSEPDLASLGLEYAVADLGTPEGCSDAIAATERQLGPIDILVCKHGLIGLMRSVALDAGAFGVTANAVLPGWVRTSMSERSAEQEATDRGISTARVWEDRAALSPAGRIVSTSEVAETAAFLASEESGGISGEAIRVALGSLS